jgi:hypothetical protein
MVPMFNEAKLSRRSFLSLAALGSSTAGRERMNNARANSAALSRKPLTDEALP